MNNYEKLSLPQDKVIIITGGAGLIGKAFSLACASIGGSVIIADMDKGRGEQALRQIQEVTGSDKHRYISCDITNKESVLGLIKSVQGEFGRIDALVNNAYPRNRNYGRKFEDVEYEDFCENVNSHLGGYFLVTKEISKVMKDQKNGNIINMASIYGFHAPRFDIYEGTEMTVPVEYAAIKGAIINLTKYLATYLSESNIRVNSISPGGVFDNQSQTFIDKYTKHVKVGSRMANTDDLVGVLLFLLSDSSGYITGQNFVVDGGWSL